jgi:hypothetical protein
MQLFSCSMRSGVQVALEVACEFGTEVFVAGAIVAGSKSAGETGAIGAGGRGDDGIAFDGAIDGDIANGLASVAAANLGRRQGVGPRAAGNGENAKPRSEKSVRGRKEPIRKCPRRDPNAGGGRPPKN